MKNVKILTLKDMSLAHTFYEIVLLIKPRDGFKLIVSDFNYDYCIRQNKSIAADEYYIHNVKDPELNKIFYDVVEERTTENFDKLTKILRAHLVQLIPEHLV